MLQVLWSRDILEVSWCINMDMIRLGDLHLISACWIRFTVPDDSLTTKVSYLFKTETAAKHQTIETLNMAYRIYAAALNYRLNVTVESVLLKEQSRFIRGRSCSDNIFTLRQLIE